jgi:hypothetical protein
MFLHTFLYDYIVYTQNGFTQIINKCIIFSWCITHIFNYKQLVAALNFIKLRKAMLSRVKVNIKNQQNLTSQNKTRSRQIREIVQII